MFVEHRSRCAARSVFSERAGVVELAQAQFGDEARMGTRRKLGHGMRRDRIGRAFESKAALPRHRFCLHADRLGVEILGAGVEVHRLHSQQ